MTLQFLKGYWDALRILPNSAKGLLVLGYVLSTILYWSSTIATPSPNAQCLNGSCVVTPEQIQTTQLLGIVLIGGITAMFLVSLTVINITLDKNPEKRDKLLGLFKGVSTGDFWNQFSPSVPSKKGLSKRTKGLFVLLWIFNGFIWGYLLPAVNPASLLFFLIAAGFVTLGSSMITIGVFALHRLSG